MFLGVLSIQNMNRCGMSTGIYCVKFVLILWLLMNNKTVTDIITNYEQWLQCTVFILLVSFYAFHFVPNVYPCEVIAVELRFLTRISISDMVCGPRFNCGIHVLCKWNLCCTG